MKQLIYESLTYPDYAKADFFRLKQKESGFSMPVFVQLLLDALGEMERYLNTINPLAWTEDVNGGKHYFKNTINLHYETEGRIKGTIQEFKELAPVVDAIKELLNEVRQDLMTKLAETAGVTESKPCFKPEFIDEVFTCLKDFFSPEDQGRLKELLSTGNHTAPPLIFNDNGNRLADVFKKLKEADIITGVQKKELEDWIRQNFQYKHRGRVKEFSKKYLNDIISTNNNPCKHPVFSVKSEAGVYKMKKL